MCKSSQIQGVCVSTTNLPSFSLSQVHAHIISYLKQEMPSVFRKDNKKKNLIYQLPIIFSKIQLQHHISPGDFPDCAKMQVSLWLWEASSV